MKLTLADLVPSHIGSLVEVDRVVELDGVSTPEPVRGVLLGYGSGGAFGESSGVVDLRGGERVTLSTDSEIRFIED